MLEHVKHRTHHASIPLEEHLLLAEDAADEIDRDIASVQFLEHVAPELILHEEHLLWLNDIDELHCLRLLVIRQVTDDIGTLVVLPHLITRRAEEGEQNLVFRIFLAKLLDERTTLFEFAKACCMKPDDARIRTELPEFSHLFGEDCCPLVASHLHLHGLLLAHRSGNLDAPDVGVDCYVIQ